MNGPADIYETPVVFGGLEGDFGYEDADFVEVDPDIQRAFYGDDDAAAA